MIGQRLQLQTAATHQRVEASLDLLDPRLTPARLRQVLERFYGFWTGTEPVIDAWAHAQPHSARTLDWTRRRRGHQLRADLHALGVIVDDLPIAPPVLAADAEHASVLGWLYVSEGSTLGGAVLDRRLTPLTRSMGVTLQSFTPYAEGPGPMWLAYQRVLDDWVCTDEHRADAVVTAACATFAALEVWLVALRDEVAA